MVRSANDINIQ